MDQDARHPQVPDRFEVLEEVASKSGRVLLRARDSVLEREVFLQRPTPEFEAHEDTAKLRETILREARALASVRDPSVARILEVLETDEAPLLVLEPACGETLAERIEREGTLDASEVIDLGIALARALELVHGAGIVHRGISADAIMLGADCQTTLFGFQFAKPAPLGSGKDLPSIVYEPGKASDAMPAHPAPEQLTHRADDARSDLFSLAWVLFESLTGAPPFKDRNPFAWKRPRDARRIVKDCPRALSRALAICLSPKPGNRLSSASAFRAALESVAGKDGRRASDRAEAQDGESVQFRRRTLWIGGAVALASLVAFWFWDRGKHLPRTPIERRDLANDTRGLVLDEAPEGALSARYETSHALLIGIGEGYRDTGFSVLPNAERDVQEVAAALKREPGSHWQIEMLLGKAATEDAVIDAIALLADRTSDDDRVLIYYAGHGLAHDRAENSGWLVPVDGVPDKRSTWIRFDELFRFFGEAGAKHIMVTLDCCYGGRLTSTRSARARAFKERFLTKKAHVVVASGRGSEVVSDGTPGKGSPFAGAFIGALRGTVTSTMVFAKIQEHLSTQRLAQTPQFGYPEGSPAGGEFVFFMEE